MRFRLATAGDLPICRTLVHPGFRAEPRVDAEIVRLWTSVVDSGSTTFTVIEDPARAHPESIEGFGFSVFVTDTFAARFSAQPEPFLAAVIYNEMLAGRSPVLSAAEIATANATSGLNLVVLHFGLRNPDMSQERTQRTLQAGMNAFYFAHSGYRLTVLFQEVYGPQQAEHVTGSGGRLLADFENHPGIARVSPEHRPFLFAQRKEWTTGSRVNPLSSLFHASKPRFGFSRTEQEVLLRALLNETDVEIGQTLGMTLNAVKKVWRRTYDRVFSVTPYLLDSEGAPIHTGRGGEKRRHLLEYLRGHLEELRPYDLDTDSRN
jgi:DNA-binding CsgD family transcriptional regulator